MPRPSLPRLDFSQIKDYLALAALIGAGWLVWMMWQVVVVLGLVYVLFVFRKPLSALAGRFFGFASHAMGAREMPPREGARPGPAALGAAVTRTVTLEQAPATLLTFEPSPAPRPAEEPAAAATLPAFTQAAPARLDPRDDFEYVARRFGVEPGRPVAVAFEPPLPIGLTYEEIGGLTTDRTVRLSRVWRENGDWYVRGACDRAGPEAMFRLDRVRQVRLQRKPSDATGLLAWALARLQERPVPDEVKALVAAKMRTPV